jgi:hypothetical protein
MTRPAALLAIALAVTALPARAQEDDAALARGQKYLDQIAQAWSARLPQDRLCGIYIGRQWVGSFTLSLKAAPGGGAAAYEMAMKGDLKFAGRTMTMESRGLLTRGLGPVSSETTEKTDEGIEKRTLSVAGGAWKLRTDKAGEITEKEGKITPGATLEAVFLPLFALPGDGELTLQSVESKKGACVFKKLAEKRDRYVDGKKEACLVIEVGHPSEAADTWYIRADGTPLELQAGDAPIRIRPVTEAQKGKPLDEPLTLKPSERRLIDLFVAISKNDGPAISGCFDFQRLSIEMAPGFADLSEEKQKATVQSMQEEMTKNLLGLHSMFPDPGLVEDAIAGAMKTTEKDGVVHIQLFGQQTWKVFEVKEGPKKGQWLIFGIDQK